jgi:hypothetical protein
VAFEFKLSWATQQTELEPATAFGGGLWRVVHGGCHLVRISLPSFSPSPGMFSTEQVNPLAAGTWRKRPFTAFEAGVSLCERVVVL